MASSPSSPRIRIPLLLTLIVSVACTGSIVEKPQKEPPLLPGQLSELDCDGKLAPRETGLRLLRKREIRGVLSAAFGDIVNTDLSILPRDEIVGSIRDYNQSPDENLGVGLMGFAINLGESVDENPAAFDPCLTAPDDACLNRVFDKWSFPILRRPLSDEERNELTRISDEESLGGAAAYLVLHPDTVFLTMFAGDIDSSDVEVDPYESAAFAAFAATDLPPTKELAQAFIDDPTTAIASLEPSNQKARELLSFYLGGRALAHIAGPEDFLGSINTDGLNEAVAEELDRFIDHVLNSDDNQYRELMTSSHFFPTTDAVADILGVSSPSPDGVVIPERVGVMSHPAILTEGSEKTSPIHRGLFMLERVFCVELSPPDPDIVNEALAAIELDPLTQSGREQVEMVTSSGDCAPCHSKINPLGFAFESFDAMGRLRTIERVFDPNEGTQIAEHTVDDDATIELDLAELATLTGERSRTVSGHKELAEFASQHPRAEVCFGRRVSELIQLHTLHDTLPDRCLENPVVQEIRKPGTSVKDTLRAAVAAHLLRELTLPTSEAP